MLVFTVVAQLTTWPAARPQAMILITLILTVLISPLSPRSGLKVDIAVVRSTHEPPSAAASPGMSGRRGACLGVQLTYPDPWEDPKSRAP